MKDIHNILFLDIETVSGKSSYEELSPRFQSLWKKKAQFFREAESQTAEELYNRAGIYAEFGRIVTIAVGYFITNENESLSLRVKAFSGHNEKSLLLEFKNLLEEHFNSKKIRLCAHNGKEFDFPYIGRRMVVNEIPVPDTLNLSGKKPWEVPHLDTMELWKFGDYKHFTSLDLLAGLFGIESSKDDIDGSQVNEVYYKENGLDRITEYCKRDVMVLAQVYLRMNQMPMLDQENIIIL